MKFCLRNESLNYPKIPGGLTQCLTETVTSSVCLIFIILLGVPSIILSFRRRSNSNARNNSIFYQLQLFSLILLSIQTVVRFILRSVYLYSHILAEYMIFGFVFGILAQFMAISVLIFDRKWGKYKSRSFVLLGFFVLQFVGENIPFASLNSVVWWWQLKERSDRVELGLWLVRYVLSFCVLCLTMASSLRGAGGSGAPRYTSVQSGDLVGGGSGIQVNQGSTWRNIFSKVRLVFNATWPSGHYLLQFKVLLCMLILVAGRVINLFLPITYKLVVDSLTVAPPNTTRPTRATGPSQLEYYHEAPIVDTVLQRLFWVGSDSGQHLRDSVTGLQFRWDLILVFSILRILQGSGIGSGGLLAGMRTQLWITVQQYSSRKVGVNLFSHIHALSLRWHMSKKTGEVLRVMDRGTDSMQNLLNVLLFQILPTIVDICIGIGYFAIEFNIFFSLIVFATMVLYFASTIIVTEWRTKYRRSMNQLDNAKNAKAVDSLLNFETVKYYNAECHEVNNYHEAIIKYQRADWLSQTTLNMLNLVQNVIINFGFLGGALLCASYIIRGDTFTVGSFVLYCTYIVQLNAPLNYFGTYYRTIQQNFIDMENMFDLLEIPQEIKDLEDAMPLQITRGEIEFKNICFGYKKDKQILKNISFKVPAGKTLALVGNSGGGKSTLMRLLFRFYDVDSGQILIDGQDISRVTQSSLRASIGVVPQDTVLFNQTIRENIRYGRLEANDLEIEEAARAADIHERIETVFPDKYDTVVGERGLKLSGGEKQRVAIARTLLKSPRIVLLDEATSALDTATERTIQASLARVSRGRTCVTVAHRLSTIVDADEIIVLHEGTIRERGRHHDLLADPNSVYAALWRQQLSTAHGPNSETQHEANIEQQLLDI